MLDSLVSLSFWLGTRNYDVSQNIESFLQAFPNKALDILDFGCSPGRDLHTFKSLGHRPVGQDDNRFDGVFANASLFHVPSQELANVLNKLHHALRPEGILFISNPRGTAEGWQGERYGHYMEYEISKAYLEQTGFKIIHHYYHVVLTLIFGISS